MNTRPMLHFPTTKGTWIPRHGRPILTPLDLLPLAVAAVMAAALFLSL